MKRFVRILLLLASLPAAARAETVAGWSTNTNAISGIAGSKQPVLIFFTADWCTYCKLMERTTLTNDAVKQIITNLTHIVVDIDAHQDLAEKYGVDGVPTFLLLSDTGTEVRRSSSFQPAPDFLRWLTNGVTDVQVAIARREAFEKKIADIDQLLVSTNTEAFREAALQLFTVCAERDDAIAHAAGERLKKVAAHDPAALVDGLVDPRLAARIQIANALRDHFGDGFDFDPWADLAERSHSAQHWRAKLTSKENP
jgi:thioredoxin-like negative regulator of GroEL